MRRAIWRGPAGAAGSTRRVPLVATQAVLRPVTGSAAGFNGTAGLLGAGIAALVLLLAAFTATSVRPRRVVQL